MVGVLDHEQKPRAARADRCIDRRHGAGNRCGDFRVVQRFTQLPERFLRDRRICARICRGQCIRIRLQLVLRALFRGIQTRQRRLIRAPRAVDRVGIVAERLIFPAKRCVIRRLRDIVRRLRRIDRLLCTLAPLFGRFEACFNRLRLLLKRFQFHNKCDILDRQLLACVLEFLLALLVLFDLTVQLRKRVFCLCGRLVRAVCRIERRLRIIERRGGIVSCRLRGKNLRIFAEVHVFLVPLIRVRGLYIRVVGVIHLRLRTDQARVEPRVQTLLKIIVCVIRALHLRARAAGGDLHGGFLRGDLVFDLLAVELRQQISLFYNVSHLDQNAFNLIGKRRIDLRGVAALDGPGRTDARLQVGIFQHLRIRGQNRLRIAALFPQQKESRRNEDHNRQYDPAFFELLFLPPGLGGGFFHFFH